MAFKLTALLLAMCVVQSLALPFLFNLPENSRENQGLSSIFQAWQSQDQASNAFVKSTSRNLEAFLKDSANTYQQLFQNIAKNIRGMMGLYETLPVIYYPNNGTEQTAATKSTDAKQQQQQQQRN